MPYALAGVFSNEPSDNKKPVINTNLLLTPVCWREFQQGRKNQFYKISTKNNDKEIFFNRVK